MKLTVTVFTSSYNHGEFLGEAVTSVLSQTHVDFEYLLFDHDSSDDSWEQCQDWAATDVRVTAFRRFRDDLPNVGAVINDSVKIASGDYWVWCPADDTLNTRLLERKMALAKEHPDAVIYSHGSIMGGGMVTPSERDPESFRQAAKRECSIGMTGIWIPRTTLFETPFPEHLNFSEDFYWMLSACKAGVDFRCVPEVLYAKRKHNNSTTARHVDEIAPNIDKIRAEVGW